MRTYYPKEALVRLSRLRLIEIGAALVLTAVAFLFVLWTVWAAEPAGVDVADAWSRPTIGKGRATAAYMTITNKGGKDDMLKSARSARAKSVELHQTSMTSEGIMQMRPVEDGLPIPAGGTLELAPGGNHLMIMGLDEALPAGGQLEVTLEFAKAGTVEIAVPVRKTAPSGSGAADAGHADH